MRGEGEGEKREGKGEGGREKGRAERLKESVLTNVGYLYIIVYVMHSWELEIQTLNLGLPHLAFYGALKAKNITSTLHPNLYVLV